MGIEYNSQDKCQLALNCEALNLVVEFGLRRGEFARIGSSPGMEITLPMVGIREEEFRLLRDDEGAFWLTPSGNESPELMELPAGFQAGPYFFSLTEQKLPHPVPPRVPPRLPPVQALPLSIAVVQTDVGLAIRPESARRKFVLVGAAIFAVIGVVIALKPKEKPPDVRSASRSEVNPVAEVAKTEAEPPAVPKDAPVIETKASDPPPPVVAAKAMDLEQLARKVKPCVFLLEVHDGEDHVSSTGTAFAISADGLIATNHHVVKGGSHFAAITEQGAKFKVARIVAEDPVADLAILQLEARDILFLALGNSNEITVGKRVAVYGSPKGLAGSLSEGIISGKRANGDVIPHNGVELLQTTAAISPGSSGSPLLDAEGNVLGIMTLGSSGNLQNLNFAVPVEVLIRLRERATVLASTGKEDSPPAPELPRTTKNDPEEALYADPDFKRLSDMQDTKDWIAALKLARQLSQKYPDAGAGHFACGYAAMRLGLDEQAETSFKRVLAIEPEDAASWYNVGCLLLRRDSTRPALTAFERSASSRPDSPDTWAKIIACHFLLNEWKKLIPPLETLAKLDAATFRRTADLLGKFNVPDTEVKVLIARLLSAEAKISSVSSAPKARQLPTFTVQGVASGDTLSVRAGPGVNFSNVYNLRNGSSGIEIIGDPVRNEETEWVQIQFNEQQGWVRKKYLKADSFHPMAKLMVESFLAHGAAGDVEQELNDYAVVVAPYFDEKAKAYTEIKSDVIAYRGRWPIREYTLLEIESASMNVEQELRTTYKFRFAVSSGGKERSGVIRQMTVFRIDSSGAWKVTAIRSFR